MGVNLFRLTSVNECATMWQLSFNSGSAEMAPQPQLLHQVMQAGV